jgi:hypothetical protein
VQQLKPLSGELAASLVISTPVTFGDVAPGGVRALHTFADCSSG